MQKISIPKPCHQDWHKMLPQQQGRFCNSCAKTVIDFTLMSDKEIQNYFVENAGEKTCGRFINTQLERIIIKLPENILYIPMPLWKMFLAVSLIVFSTTLFSCDTNYNLAAQNLQVNSHITSDTTHGKNNISPQPFLGKVVARDTTPIKKECKPTMGIIARPVELKGKVSIVPTTVKSASKTIKPIKPTPVPQGKLGEVITKSVKENPDNYGKHVYQ